MRGVGANLEAALNQRYENRQIDAPGSADDSGIAEVVRLMLREELTGSPPPKNLSMVMDLWRPWVKSRAGELISELIDQLDDQSAFAELSRRLIGALESDLGDSASDEDQDSEAENDQEDNGDGQSEQDGDQSALGEDQSEGDDSQSTDDAGDTGASENGEMMDSEGADDGSSDGESPNAEITGDNSQGGMNNDRYLVFETKFDEITSAADLCEPQELERLRVMLDRHMENVTSIVGKLANRLQRKLMAHQNRSWDFDLEEGFGCGQTPPGSNTAIKPAFL